MSIDIIQDYLNEKYNEEDVKIPKINPEWLIGYYIGERCIKPVINDTICILYPRDMESKLAGNLQDIISGTNYYIEESSVCKKFNIECFDIGITNRITNLELKSALFGKPQPTHLLGDSRFINSIIPLLTSSSLSGDLSSSLSGDLSSDIAFINIDVVKLNSVKSFGCPWSNIKIDANDFSKLYTVRQKKCDCDPIDNITEIINCCPSLLDY